MPSIATLILTLLLAIAPQFGVDTTIFSTRVATFSEELQTFVAEAPASSDYPQDKLYPSNSEVMELGSLDLVVRSAIADRHCWDCGSGLVGITVYTYITNNARIPVAASGVIRAGLIGRIGDHSYLWESSRYMSGSDIPAGMTRSHYSQFVVPARATDFSFGATTCARGSWSCADQPEWVELETK